MIALFYTCVFGYLYTTMGFQIEYYVLSGLALLIIAKGLRGFKFSGFRYLKMFEIALTTDNKIEFVACMLFFTNYYLATGILFDISTVITLPSLALFFFYSSFISINEK